MNILVLKRFNNYFNRKVKIYSELSEYESASQSYRHIPNINFNPNDGVRTELILGVGLVDGFFDFEKTNTADYLICYTTETPEESGASPINTIESRWFITEVKRTRSGQFLVQLKRDSIADNFNNLLSCPAYIKKGIVGDTSPYIVNNEGINVNQIKSDSVPLKDRSSSAWLVGYMAKNFGIANTVSVQVNKTTKPYITIEDLAEELGVDSADLSAALTTSQNNPSFFINDNIELVGWVNMADGSALEWKLIAGSQNNLESITYNKFNSAWHNNTADCFAKEKDADYWSRLHFDGFSTYWKNAITPSISQIKSGWKTFTNHPMFTRSMYDTLKRYADRGTLIYKAGVYYNINIGKILGPTNTDYPVGAVSAPFDTICSKFVNDWNTAHASSYWKLQIINNHAGNIFINYNELTVNLYLTEASVDNISYTMSSARNACADQPFDMFAIPYDGIPVKNGATYLEGIGTQAQELSVKLAQKIVQNETTYQIYDLQLLPYCPIPEICTNGMIDITNLTATKDYDYITQTGEYVVRDESSGSMTGNEFAPGMYEGEYYVNTGIPVADIVDIGYSIDDSPYQVSPVKTEGTSDGKKTIKISCLINDFHDAEHIDVTVWWTYKTTGTMNKSVVIYPKKASFDVTINQTLSLKDEMKIEANCNNYRLVSPNYQGSFDFNVAKNGGSVNSFIAKCTYKPYTPYIRVAPEFKWLYSTNYDKEARGLICGGDFSISIINDKWEEFQLQNKNYQNIFNREIQSMDVNQYVQRMQHYISGGLGVATGGVTGAAGGARTGAAAGPYGAVAGAIIGGVLGTAGSGIGYGYDSQLMEKQLIEQRQFTIDKYNLQLGNIQALPYTLTKVGAFDKDSMIFPFLEYYTCTDEEKEALRMKITYEGMTLGIVDRLGNYLLNPGYIQADLIRNEEIMEDSHQLDDIYIELSKGVYL